MTRVLVIGGGVIGLSTAWELARHGASVRLIERGTPGQEASWAGAGMLPPGGLDGPPTTEVLLRAHSHRLWHDWAARLHDDTGIDTGYRVCGCLEVSHESAVDKSQSEIEQWRREGVPVEPLDPHELQRRFPAVKIHQGHAYWLPDYAQVRNPRLLKALYAACSAAGVEFVSGTPVQQVLAQSGTAVGVRTPTGDMEADVYVVASGAWSSQLLDTWEPNLNVQPVRGQIVLLEQQPLTVSHIVQCGLQYIVPRPDGRVLIGATEEHAGFEKRNTAAALHSLLEFGLYWLPSLATARFERCWSGLRPYRPGGLPLIGRVPGLDNLLVAAGHFRAGLQLSPITATLLRELILQQSPTIPTSLLPPLGGRRVTET